MTGKGKGKQISKAANKTQKTNSIVGDPDLRKRMKQGLVTITQYYQVIDDQKESIKEIVADMSDQFGIDKKLIRKLASTMYRQNYASLKEEERHFDLLWEILVEGKLTKAVDPLDNENDDVDEIEQEDLEDLEELEELETA